MPLKTVFVQYLYHKDCQTRWKISSAPKEIIQKNDPAFSDEHGLLIQQNDNEHMTEIGKKQIKCTR